jgi:hypothetical protein
MLYPLSYEGGMAARIATNTCHPRNVDSCEVWSLATSLVAYGHTSPYAEALGKRHVERMSVRVPSTLHG